MEEIGRLFDVHKNTVRNWLKSGLPTIDRRRPTLIFGADLQRFLQKRRIAAKQVCALGEVYCVKCRAPKRPAAGMVEYVPLTASGGNLRALCPDCSTLIYRRVSRASLAGVASGMDVTFPEGEQRIEGCNRHCVTCDLERASESDANEQPKQ